jgi:hypothetical protein
MKKSIEVKGNIKVDKKGMSEVHGGKTCGSISLGAVCKSYKAAQEQIVTRAAIILDELLP